MSREYPEHIQAQVLKAYLLDMHSHRRIQEDILQIPAPNHGGGFKTMEILHSYGIGGEKKGALCRSSVDEELATASDGYKAALLLVKKYYAL